FFPRAVSFGGIQKLCDDHAVKHAVPCVSGIVRVAIRSSALRQLRKRNQKRRLVELQSFWFLAVPGEGRCAYTLKISAVWGKRQVALEDLLLRQPSLDLDCADHLAQLGGDGSLLAWLQ